jgi:uncharacterized protein YdaU (DUF1376 family)
VNYYPHHIGDYDSHTAHLTWAEDLAYRRLICLYYRTEKPLVKKVDDVCRLIRAQGSQEKKAVVQVLNEFFVLTEKGWCNTRCDDEISKAQAKAERNREVGKKGGRPKKQETKTVDLDNPEITQMVSENNPNITLPITNNQKPITNSQEPHTHTETIQTSKPSMAAAVCVLLKAEGIGSVNPQNPTLTTLIDQGASIGLFAEAARIAKEKQKGFAYVLGVVDRQMQEAAAMAKQERANPSQATETPHERSMRLRYEEATGKRSSEARETIDITPRQTPKPELVRIA